MFCVIWDVRNLDRGYKHCMITFYYILNFKLIYGRRYEYYFDSNLLLH